MPGVSVLAVLHSDHSTSKVYILPCQMIHLAKAKTCVQSEVELRHVFGEISRYHFAEPPLFRR